MTVTTPALLAEEFRNNAYTINHKAGDVVIATAARIQADAKRAAPVDTGFLRASITRETVRRQHDVEAQVGPEAHYGIYVELGTWRKPGGKPYLFPAAERHTPAFEEAIGKLAEWANVDVSGSIGREDGIPDVRGDG